MTSPARKAMGPANCLTWVATRRLGRSPWYPSPPMPTQSKVEVAALAAPSPRARSWVGGACSPAALVPLDGRGWLTARPAATPCQELSHQNMAEEARWRDLRRQVRVMASSAAAYA